jgi:hypothetical protein
MFVVRVAGNCCDMSTRASLQYAVAHLGVKLVVVLGGPLQPQPSAPVSRWLSSALAPFPSPRRLGMWRVHSVLSASAACDGWVVGNNRLALRPSLHVPQRRARGLWCGGSCSSIRLNQGGDAGGSARAAACAVLDSNPTASTLRAQCSTQTQRPARCVRSARLKPNGQHAACAVHDSNPTASTLRAQCTTQTQRPARSPRRSVPHGAHAATRRRWHLLSGIRLGSGWDPVGIWWGSGWDPVGIWLGSGWDPVGIWWGSAVDLVGIGVGSGGDLVGIRLGSDHLA